MKTTGGTDMKQDDWSQVMTYLYVAAALFFPIFLLTNQGVAFWFKAKFAVHRVFGLAFLFQYMAAWYIFITDYNHYLELPFPYTMSATLLVQVSSAIYYFRFLPKLDVKTADPGMYSDKGVLPYDWVKENMFFAIMITWGNIYYHEPSFSMVRRFGGYPMIGTAIEVLFVMFPFEVMRPLFPKTHLKNAFIYRAKTTSAENVFFYDCMTWAGKIFYMISKHTIGFFLQYVRFCDGLTAESMYWIRWWMLMNIGIHNIGTFVHTLRFKKLIEPKLAFVIYIGYWAVSNFAIYKLIPVYYSQWYIFLVTFTGMFVNFARSRAVRFGFQILVCALMVQKRFYTDS
mmetsp:Transcript_440/g.1172  ORF Transcript_440/g.1172 Transcript_440/m.1172 type:complete len:342 (-) Transcript_440:92-1117(-)